MVACRWGDWQSQSKVVHRGGRDQVVRFSAADFESQELENDRCSPTCIVHEEASAVARVVRCKSHPVPCVAHRLDSVSVCLLHAIHLLQVPYLALHSATRQRTENRRMPQGTRGAFGLAVQRPVRGMHNIGLIDILLVKGAYGSLDT